MSMEGGGGTSPRSRHPQGKGAELTCVEIGCQVDDRSVAGGERWEPKAMLDRGQYRDRVVLHVGHRNIMAQAGRNDQRGNPRAWTPFVVRTIRLTFI